MLTTTVITKIDKLPEKWTDAAVELLKLYDDDKFLNAISTNLNEYSLTGEKVSSYYSKCAIYMSQLKDIGSKRVDIWISKEIKNFKHMAKIEARKEDEFAALRI